MTGMRGARGLPNAGVIADALGRDIAGAEPGLAGRAAGIQVLQTLSRLTVKVSMRRSWRAIRFSSESSAAL
jgi:hypothetical protein